MARELAPGVEPLDVVKRVCFTKSQFEFILRRGRSMGLRDSEWQAALRQILEKEMKANG